MLKNSTNYPNLFIFWFCYGLCGNRVASSGSSPQLTIFYGGTVSVFNDISPDKVYIYIIKIHTNNIYISFTCFKLDYWWYVSRLKPSCYARGTVWKVKLERVAWRNNNRFAKLKECMENISITLLLLPHQALPFTLILTQDVGTTPLLRLMQWAWSNHSMQFLVTWFLQVYLKYQYESNHYIFKIFIPHIICLTKLIKNCLISVPQARKASLARFLEKRKERFDTCLFFRETWAFRLNLKELNVVGAGLWVQCLTRRCFLICRPENPVEWITLLLLRPKTYPYYS